MTQFWIKLFDLFSVELNVIESCDNTYNKTTQEISYSRTNTSNVTLNNCSWRITVPDDRNVILDIIDLHIESSRNCKTSSLEVFDGPEARSARIGEKICGSQTRSSIESSGNELYLKYSSKASLIHDDQFSIKCSISGTKSNTTLISKFSFHLTQNIIHDIMKYLSV